MDDVSGHGGLPVPGFAGEVSLDNCEREPIHVPGSIQPHGALLAFDRLGRLSQASANAAEILGAPPNFGARLDAGGLPPAAADPKVVEALRAVLEEGGTPRSLQATLAGRDFDVVVHARDGRVLCEFEFRERGEDVSSFALLAFRALEEIKRHESQEALLAAAVEAVRAITGFDRVMAYRFAQDDSGEVIAEARADKLEAYLGRRYPASDIPAQARRLYVLNTLRLIADVADRPVPMAGDGVDARPLDMSLGLLRSVSPIHVEYLTNMGVRASMSVSIVIDGRLWGMLACHHLAPKRVPYPIRMAVDVMAQVIASRVQAISAQRREAAIARAAGARADIARALASGEDIAEMVARERAALRAELSCDAVACVSAGSAREAEGVDGRWLAALAAWLSARGERVVEVVDGALLPEWPEDVPERDRFRGVLALRCDAASQVWIIALRRERVHTIRWGGKPDKVIAHGPRGPRLTPRGSFDEWRQTVRGQASPWSEIQREIASQLRDAVAAAREERARQVDSMRSQLWAILGHDLRNPLQSINMASTAIERGAGAASGERLNAIIRNSASRMNRLLSDVLDLSRLQRGFGLSVQREEMDLSALLRQLVDETTTAYPAFRVELVAPPALPMRGDAGRLAQLFANLLSNARHHGEGGVVVDVRQDGGAARIRASNPGKPIAPERVGRLFDPFKDPSMSNPANPTGLGLGLYIADQVARAHGGTLGYAWGDGQVAFEAVLPLA
jgi:light-regulated signal transduction histidine kinase (bacteriophytochrome)